MGCRELTVVRLACLVAISFLMHAQQITVIAGGTGGGGHSFGFSSDRNYTFGAVQFAFPIAHPAGGTFFYRFDAIPVSYLREPRLVAFDSRRLSPDNHFIYGGGANPLAFEYDTPRFHRTHPFADYTGGFLYFSRRVFSPLASQFNFTTSLGGGFLFQPPHAPPLRLGYRYTHISNANIATRNPGGDFQLLYLGVAVHAPTRK